MRTTLICNPNSGRGVDAESVADEIRRLGAEIVEIARSPKEGRGDGAERIIVVGGDGSIAPAAALASRLGVPLAVVPAGTANDFARALGLPLDLDAAVELAVRGERTTELELAAMDDRPFVNAASTGLSPAAARRAAPLKGRLGPLAYPLGALLAGVLDEPVPCRALVDGREAFDGPCWQLTVAATGAFGGGAEIDAANPEDGRLDLVVVPGGTRLKLPSRALAMRRGTLAEEPGVVHVRGDHLEVHVPRGTSFNVDGEIFEVSAAALRFSARAAAFEVVSG